MKIEKIKNYNQMLLAVLGTIAIIFALVGLIAFAVMIIDEFRWNRNNEMETGILSEEKIEELQKENKREQVISYELPQLVDTPNAIYIIPVSHITLHEPEGIQGLLDASYSNSKQDIDSRYASQFYGVYNNLIVYDQKAETSNKLFEKRVNFNEIKAEYFSDDILLLFKVAEKDTYRDGVINLQDYKSLYIYSISEGQLKKIGNDDMDIFSYAFLGDSKDLIIQFGIDKNKNGRYKSYNEPTIIKRYHYLSGSLTDIVNPTTHTNLQMMLEGSEK
ncbi:hypothetical protein QQ020_07590 [Fulvivirgaceae bacterium BMA12]|uniref:Uncharacterized protein n=1 Tax=Agaribacillus aureus TaxID=3051825 RepID=A0ABT8L6Q3_9BACT|nr:hypothetical protein [Fulvivirgaceae bacterium BMA12]